MHIQNHDQIGNRLLGDRLIASYGRERALLGITAVMASPFVPMLFMGEEYGETAPFLFFEDFSDERIVEGAREGRKADFAFGGIEPPDPHARKTFEDSKLRWERAATPQGQSILQYYRKLIALKKTGALGPRRRTDVKVDADPATRVLRVETPQSLTVMNFSAESQPLEAPPGWKPLFGSDERSTETRLAPYAAAILGRS